MIWHAVYVDGTSPVQFAREVRITSLGLDLQNGVEREHWPWAEVVALMPLRPGEPVRLGHRQTQARLRIDDVHAAASLLALAPVLADAHGAASQRRPFSRKLQLRIAAAAAAILFSIVRGPEIAATLTPDTVAEQLGDGVLDILAPADKRCTNPDTLAAARALVARLDPDHAYRVEVAKLGLPNAAAMPGRRIVLGHEIVTFAKSPNEVAFVLAHEIAHEINSDPLIGFVRANGVSVLFQLLTGGSTTASNAGVASVMPTMTRRAETRADRDGLRLLERANIKRDGIAAFWTRFEASYKSDSGFFATHPGANDRARAANTDMHDGGDALDATQWAALQKCN
jgi:Zn-dependent protease with chaperone function